MSQNKLKIAVVLSGCGFLDGAEIHESVMTLWAIEKHGAEPVCFAPDIDQYHVVNHLTGLPVAGQKRNVLEESARIARGKITGLADFDPNDVDAVVFPGGFGAAKNLSTFAFDGAACQVQENVANVIRTMHRAGKPIGALCIAPALLARVLPGVHLTIGADAGTAAVLESMGACHCETGHGQITVDATNKVVSTPCYMLESSVPQIGDGADRLVEAVIGLIS